MEQNTFCLQRYKFLSAFVKNMQLLATLCDTSRLPTTLKLNTILLSFYEYISHFMNIIAPHLSTSEAYDRNRSHETVRLALGARCVIYLKDRDISMKISPHRTNLEVRCLKNDYSVQYNKLHLEIARATDATKITNQIRNKGLDQVRTTVGIRGQ